MLKQVRSKSEPLKIILEAQYRPSQDAMVIEVLSHAFCPLFLSIISKQELAELWVTAGFGCRCQQD